MLDDAEGAELAAQLLHWFAQNRRALPWREHYAPYAVWISEIMLQQTQMERGVTYFLRWMERFPDVAAVARATEEEILHAWEGLGYYRRARMLHAAAKAMMERHEGRVPESVDALKALPGLGEYTVAAIRGIAFQHDVVTIDANVERVFSRVLNIEEAPKKKVAAAVIRDAATRFLPPGRARDYNQALMEFGALVCGKVPHCEDCPVTKHCASRRVGVERERPVREEKAPVIAVSGVYGVLIHHGEVLVSKRPEGGLWGGLWEFPGATVKAGDTPKRALLQAFAGLGLTVTLGKELGRVKHGYTNHRLSAIFYRVEWPNGPNGPHGTDNNSDAYPAVVTRWVPCNETDRLAMPAHHRKFEEAFGILQEK